MEKTSGKSLGKLGLALVAGASLLSSDLKGISGGQVRGLYTEDGRVEFGCGKKTGTNYVSQPYSAQLSGGLTINYNVQNNYFTNITNVNSHNTYNTVNNYSGNIDTSGLPKINTNLVTKADNRDYEAWRKEMVKLLNKTVRDLEKGLAKKVDLSGLTNASKKALETIYVPDNTPLITYPIDFPNPITDKPKLSLVQTNNYNAVPVQAQSNNKKKRWKYYDFSVRNGSLDVGDGFENAGREIGNAGNHLAYGLTLDKRLDNKGFWPVGESVNSFGQFGLNLGKTVYNFFDMFPFFGALPNIKDDLQDRNTLKRVLATSARTVNGAVDGATYLLPSPVRLPVKGVLETKNDLIEMVKHPVEGGFGSLGVTALHPLFEFATNVAEEEGRGNMRLENLKTMELEKGKWMPYFEWGAGAGLMGWGIYEGVSGDNGNGNSGAGSGGSLGGGRSGGSGGK